MDDKPFQIYVLREIDTKELIGNFTKDELRLLLVHTRTCLARIKKEDELTHTEQNLLTKIIEIQIHDTYFI